MFPERSQTPTTKSNPKREAGVSGEGMCASTLTPLCSVIKKTDTPSAASDDGAVVLASSGPLNSIRIPIPAAPQLRGLGPQTDSPMDAAPKTTTKQAKGPRTHFVWISAGDGPSITCTSPTPPPSTRRVPRRPPTLSRARDALAPPTLHLSPLAHRPTHRHVDSEENERMLSEPMTERHEIRSDFAKPAGSSVEVDDRARSEPVPERPPAAGPSHRRTLADYDRTNARIRALNAELLLPNPRSQRYSHSYHTPARRTQRSTVRYLNVPGAAVDALTAVRALRRSEARRRASSSRTGIVDISESESSEFESGDENEEEEEEEGPGRANTPGGTNSKPPEAGTVGEACSETRVCAEISRGERLGHLQAASTASAEAEDRCVSVAGSSKAITHPPAPTDADADAGGSQWQLSRTRPFARDRARAAEEDRLQPGHLPVLLQNSAPTSTSAPLLTVPHRQGKKRARADDTDDIYGDPVHMEASEGLAREGKRRKASSGASMSAT